MIISDLNYIEAVESDVVGGFNLGWDYSNIYFNEYFNIYKDVDSKTYVEGNLATAEAYAYGEDSLSQTFTYVNPIYSNSVSISATN